MEVALEEHHYRVNWTMSLSSDRGPNWRNRFYAYRLTAFSTP
ncbi:hypothetical protein THF1C08_100019 [Vibrio jasicida]|uniref:Uncharacterized protein n=1 Tax=Vibrio jasicida TaxID=766224 RepID=A0AAU9QZX2_9VIBR|nr:hypothetical protein THF1C08_100019 [Vibrio jasicida]CAH1603915.1 hypothetical protein THF1A12_90019 [Vibrio jasicida]